MIPARQETADGLVVKCRWVSATGTFEDSQAVKVRATVKGKLLVGITATWAGRVSFLASLCPRHLQNLLVTSSYVMRLFYSSQRTRAVLGRLTIVRKGAAGEPRAATHGAKRTEQLHLTPSYFPECFNATLGVRAHRSMSTKCSLRAALRRVPFCAS